MMTALGALVMAVAAALTPLSASQGAVRASTAQIGPPPVTEAPSGPCAEWSALAIEAGWSADQWPRLAAIMWCESRCDPHAHNRSGASGLLQIMPMHWHGRDPYDPAINLAMGVEVYEAQGWHAWTCA